MEVTIDEKEVIREICENAAEWWAMKIGGMGSNHDNGDRTGASGLAGIFANMMNQLVSDEKAWKFKDILAGKLMKRYEDGYPHTWMMCDYGPDQILAESAKEAGISSANFPWKTAMHVEYEKGEVLVSDGYQAPWVRIFPEDMAPHIGVKGQKWGRRKDPS